jgi:uncharacterized protein Yka (UPF0111/DUF47 family)
LSKTRSGETGGDDGLAAKPSVPSRRRWWKRVILPAVPDVVALLVKQGEIAEVAMVRFDAWSHGGGDEAAQSVRDCVEHGAYEARRDLLSALQAALSTPVDQEDLYVLSERTDRILTEAKSAVREADVLHWPPDEHAATMSGYLLDGVRNLLAGFRLLLKDPEQAGREADDASEAVRHVERAYREAMAGLQDADDLRGALAAQEIYRRYHRIAEAVVSVADRLWYAVLRGA